MTQKHILFVVAGISPAIITEAFYKLYVEENIPIAEIWIITTAVGNELISSALLNETGAFEQLCRDYAIERSSIRFDTTTIIVAEDHHDQALSDMRKDDENAIFPNRLIELFQQLTRTEDTVVHACLSGGRKSMSFYLGATMMMLGRKQDELIHVIISRELELCKPIFYYPTPSQKIGEANINGKNHREDYSRAEIILSRIPFLRLRNQIPIFRENLSYPELVNLLQSHVDKIQDGADINYPGCYPVSAVMKALLARVRQIPDRETILITGETGTGKEILAKYIHNHFAGERKPYRAVNLGMIQKELIRAELFGYKKGAFTGAKDDQPGMFDVAANGTLFLDEIDKLPKELQPALLRVLQEKIYLPVGSTVEKQVRCHIVIGTNQDLKQLVESGKFYPDLYYRIEAFRLNIPSLRERKEDLLPLANYFLAEYSQRYNKAFRGLSGKLQQEIIQHNWPGNVRELENFLKQKVAFQSGNTLDTEPAEHFQEPGQQPDKGRYDVATQQIIESALTESGGNVAQAARILGIKYTTLQSRIKKLGINSSNFRS